MTDIIPAKVLRLTRLTGSLGKACHMLGHTAGGNASRALREMYGVILNRPYAKGGCARQGGESKRKIFVRGFAQSTGVDLCPEKPYASANAMPLGMF